MAQVEDLVELAEQCLTAAKQVKEYLASNGHQQPSFNQNGPTSFPQMSPKAEQARMQLRTLSQRLSDLSTGPDEFLNAYVYGIVHDIGAFRYVQQFKILDAVPLNDHISYQELASRTGTDQGQLKQRIRQLMMINVFCEPEPGFVAHTAASKALLDKDCADYNGWQCLDVAPLVLRNLDAIQKWGHGSQEPNQTGWQIMSGTDDIVWNIWKDYPETAKRFTGVMRHASQLAPWSIEHAVKAFDWASIGSGTVVDIGGNTGHCSIAFAQVAPNATFIVQDLPEVITRATDPTTTIIPPSLRSRISFLPHDFFTPQPIKSASIYFLRMILHDWPDKYAIQILQSIIPAMQPNHSRILIMDQIQPQEVGAIPQPIERVNRTQDCMMSCMFNAAERDLNEWNILVRSADERLRIMNVFTSPGSVHSIVEVGLVDGSGSGSENERKDVNGVEVRNGK